MEEKGWMHCQHLHTTHWDHWPKQDTFKIAQDKFVLIRVKQLFSYFTEYTEITLFLSCLLISKLIVKLEVISISRSIYYANFQKYIHIFNSRKSLKIIEIG